MLTVCWTVSQEFSNNGWKVRLMEIKTFLEYNETDTPNIMLVKEFYKIGAEGGGLGYLKILSDNPTWNVCPGTPEGGIYCGLNEVFGTFYVKLMKILIGLRAEPEVFVDGGNFVTVLGFYNFKAREDGPSERVRFSHSWKITPDNRIDGVWQVCDSFKMREFLKNEENC